MAILQELTDLSIKEIESLIQSLFLIDIASPEYIMLKIEYEKMVRSEISKVFNQKIYSDDIKDANFLHIEADKDSLENALQNPSKRQKSLNLKSVALHPNSGIIMTDELSFYSQEISNSLNNSMMIIINGKAGSGKSDLVNHISHMKGKQNDKITLYLDSTTDLKSLIGNYTCSENLGEFEWKDGPLTTAMLNDKWLLLENFQESNDELGSSLLSIIEKEEMYVSNTGRTIKATLGFKIIAISDYDKETSSKNENDLNRLYNIFDKIPIINLNNMNIIDNLKKILIKKFGSENKNDNIVLEKIIEIIDLVVLHNNNHSNKKIKIVVKNFINLMSRVNYQIKLFYGDIGFKENYYMTEAFRLTIVLEIIDVIFEKYRDKDEYIDVLEQICEKFDLNPETTFSFLQNFNPKIEITQTSVNLGRLSEISRTQFLDNTTEINQIVINTLSSNLIYNSFTTRLIEKIACCLFHNESCLLVGDTGCGKTTIAQHVAEIFRKTLHVYNLSQGSDAIDLIGGFKPIEMKIVIKNLLVKYVKNLLRIVSEKSNEKFLESLRNLYNNKNYSLLLKAMIESFKMITEKINKTWIDPKDPKRIKIEHNWNKIHKRLVNIFNNKEKIETNLAFEFIEGNLIKALKKGDWILIDEINLANNEVLQKLLPIIEGNSILLYEKGDLKEIKRHENFRLIGCMNPGSDIGKRELPNNIRGKFTELFVPDLLDKKDIMVLYINFKVI